MALTGSIDVDEAAQTVQIIFEENGAPFSDHTYSAVTGRVTSPALSGAVISLTDYDDGVKLFTPWRQMVTLRHNPPKTKESEYVYELEKDIGMVKLTATLGGTKVQPEWDSGTGMVTIEPRDPLDLIYADFLLFIDLLRLFARKAKEF